MSVASRNSRVFRGRDRHEDDYKRFVATAPHRQAPPVTREPGEDPQDQADALYRVELWNETRRGSNGCLPSRLPRASATQRFMGQSARTPIVALSSDTGDVFSRCGDLPSQRPVSGCNVATRVAETAKN